MISRGYGKRRNLFFLFFRRNVARMLHQIWKRTETTRNEIGVLETLDEMQLRFCHCDGRDDERFGHLFYLIAQEMDVDHRG